MKRSGAAVVIVHTSIVADICEVYGYCGTSWTDNGVALIFSIDLGIMTQESHPAISSHPQFIATVALDIKIIVAVY